MPYSWKKNTAIFLSSQAVSLFGSSLVQYAITWHITLTTKSGVFTMLSILCGFLPMFILSPFAGVWADRYDRRKLIAIADGVIAAATLLLAILWISGIQSTWLLLAVMAVRSIGGAVQSPCVSAILPSMVPTEHLTRVNGINGSLQSLMNLFSPMLSGALLSLASISSIFFIDVVTAAAAIVVLLFLFKLPKSLAPAEKTEDSNYLTELKLGISYIIKTPFLISFFTIAIFLWLLLGPVAFLTPLQVARSFGDDVWRLTAVEIAFSVGMLGGGVLISIWGGFKNRIHTACLSSFLMAAGTCALGFPIPFWPYIGCMCFIGLTLPFSNTPMIAMLQEKTDPAYMGRVFGVMTMLSSSMMPLGMLVFGPLADQVPIEYLLIVTGVSICILSVIMLRNKPLLEAGKTGNAGDAGDASKEEQPA